MKLQWDKVASHSGSGVNVFGNESKWTLTSFLSELQFPFPPFYGWGEESEELPSCSFPRLWILSCHCFHLSVEEQRRPNITDKHFSEAVLPNATSASSWKTKLDLNLALTSRECGSMCAYVLRFRGTLTPPSTTSSHAGMCTISTNDKATTFLSCFTQ